MSRVEIRRTSGSLPISDFLSQLLCVRRNAFLSPPYIRAWMEGVEFTIRASGSVASHQSFLRVRFESSDSIGLAVMLFFSTFAFFIRREPARVSRVAWVEIFGRNHPKMSALWRSDTFFPSGYAQKLRRRERLRFFCSVSISWSWFMGRTNNDDSLRNRIEVSLSFVVMMLECSGFFFGSEIGVYQFDYFSAPGSKSQSLECFDRQPKNWAR